MIIKLQNIYAQRYVIQRYSVQVLETSRGLGPAVPVEVSVAQNVNVEGGSVI